ncbi:MAG TPA: DUF805 domain-containing protein [Cytophagales bacterium]|jgi:uncharacterized membrane protein YhaH (DUF805 family)
MFNQPFSFQGRIRRTEFGISYVIYLVATAFINLLTADSDAPGMTLLLYIPLIWFILAQATKRCHDRDNSGWYQLIPFYTLWMLFAEGDKGDNNYGPDPKGSVSTV